MKPIRIQRSRKKGSKLPPNTVCVTRGTKWGNPYRKAQGHDDPVESFREWIMTGVSYVHCEPPPTLKEIRSQLGGKNLACWCKPDEACHAKEPTRILESIRVQALQRMAYHQTGEK